MVIDEGVLDDAAALAERDPHGVLLALASAGAQLRAARDAAKASTLVGWAGMERPRAILVAARGGATLVGPALATLIGRSGPVPVMATSGSTLPAWVGPVDVVVAVSLSTQADTTASVASEAGRRGALLLTVGPESSALAEASRMARGVHVDLVGQQLGVTLPTSRAAFWSLLAPVLVACEMLNVVSGATLDLDAVAERLDSEAEMCRPSSESFVNPAKSLALQLTSSLPMLLGADEVAGVAAQRAVQVLSGSARIPALCGTLPNDAGVMVGTFGGELGAGNDIFADPDEQAKRLRLFMVGDSDSATARAVRQIAERYEMPVSPIHDDGGSDLARLAQLIARIDFAAVYAALGRDIDPSVNPGIADLRDALG